MKLLAQYSDSLDAEGVSERMRRAGVMTVVTSKRSHNLSRFKTGAFKVGLWAVFDDQHDDAVQLLKNKRHKPGRVISLDEMKELENAAKDQFATTSKRFFEKAATLIFGGALVALLTYVVWGLINDA